MDVLTHMSAYEAPPYFATVPSCVRVPNTPTQPLRLRHLAIVGAPQKGSPALSSPASTDRISRELMGVAALLLGIAPTSSASPSASKARAAHGSIRNDTISP